MHHKTTDDEEVKTCNYGPDLADHIFNTNCRKTTFENYNHIIPNTLMSFLILGITGLFWFLRKKEKNYMLPEGYLKPF